MDLAGCTRVDSLSFIMGLKLSPDIQRLLQGALNELQYTLK